MAIVNILLALHPPCIAPHLLQGLGQIVHVLAVRPAGACAARDVRGECFWVLGSEELGVRGEANVDEAGY